MTTQKRARRSGFRPQGGSSARRSGEWYDFNLSATLTSGASTIAVLMTGLADDEKSGMTVVRTVIDLTLWPLTTIVRTTVSLGMVMITTDAVAAGAAPDPSDTLDNPGWMWRGQRVLRTSNVNDSPRNGHILLDLRGKRKFNGPDMDLVMIVENSASGISADIDGLVRVYALKS